MDMSYEDRILECLTRTGYTAPDMLANAETITTILRSPKGRTMAALDNLVQQGLVRRIAGETQGYFVEVTRLGS